MTTPLLQVRRVRRRFPVKESLFGAGNSFVHAVNSVSLEVEPGQTVGLVGESGCGKSTLGRLIAGLDTPDEGEIFFRQEPLKKLLKENQNTYHRKVQIIFQNPYGALNPRQRIFQTFREVFRVHRRLSPEETPATIEKLLQRVGISPDSLHRYAFEFSGGQRQRICIARALAVNPELIICDEPVSALDVSVQSQILKLMQSLQQELNLAYIFISHDLSVVYHICEKVYIMYLGQILENGTTEEVFNQPRHPYTQALLSAVPVPHPGGKRHRIVLRGDVPGSVSLPSGCPFHTRCPKKMPHCAEVGPPRTDISATHQAKCWLLSQ